MSGAAHKPALAYGVNVVDNHLEADLPLFLAGAFFKLFPMEILDVLSEGQVSGIENTHGSVIVPGGEHTSSAPDSTPRHTPTAMSPPPSSRHFSSMQTVSARMIPFSAATAAPLYS